MELKKTVVKVFQEKYGMADANLANPLSLVKKHIPADFHSLNQRGRRCTQLELVIEEIDETTQTCREKWIIELNADKGTSAQRAHYGFRVQWWQAASQIDKVTGHIFLPDDDVPDNPRGPPNNPDLGECNIFCQDKVKKGGDDNRGTIFFHIEGKWWNRLYSTKGLAQWSS